MQDKELDQEGAGSPLEMFVSSAEFRRWFDRCVAFAFSYTSDRSESEHIASEALATLWQKTADGEEIKAPLPFLFSIVRNKALKYLRHKYIAAKSHSDIKYSAVTTNYPKWV